MATNLLQISPSPASFPLPAGGRNREGGRPPASGPGAIPLPTRSGRIVPAVAAVLALAGLVLFGQAAWIYTKAWLAQILLERAFAQSLATGEIVKPWPWADTWPVARIEVPRLNRSVIVLHGASGQALAFGPGHVDLTPAAGERGTAVYSAHRETHFAFLAAVAPGDLVRITRRDGARFSFRVTGTSVVRWDNSGIDPLAPGQNVVLSTCWPLDARTAGPLRYLVHAAIVDD